MTQIERLALDAIKNNPRRRAAFLLRRVVAECSRAGAPPNLKFRHEVRDYRLNWTYSTSTLNWKTGDWRDNDEMG